MLAAVLALALHVDKQAPAHPGEPDDADGVSLSGGVSLGVLPYNPSYAARPDNSGLALLRYAPHFELSLLDDLVSLIADFTFFTDRASPLAPSELDLAFEVALRHGAWELHLGYERDLPVDRGGLVQTMASCA